MVPNRSGTTRNREPLRRRQRHESDGDSARTCTPKAYGSSLQGAPERATGATGGTSARALSRWRSHRNGPPWGSDVADRSDARPARQATGQGESSPGHSRGIVR